MGVDGTERGQLPPGKAEMVDPSIPHTSYIGVTGWLEFDLPADHHRKGVI